MDEAEPIRRAKDGELECFNQLVLRYQTQVYNLSFRMVGHSATAEDITQESFVSAYRKLRSFQAGNFLAWLMRIATNACMDHFRSAHSKRNVSLEELEENPSFSPTSGGESPEAYALRRELGEVLKQSLLSIPSDQRIALILIDLQGLSYDEASQVIGVPIGTVKSRLSRGRIAMRERLQNKRELLPSGFRFS